MTCIASWVDTKTNKIYMASDSAGISNSDIVARRDPKIFKNGNFLIGYSSSFRMGQVLMFSDLLKELSPPVTKSEKYMFKFMVTSFIPIIRYDFKENGVAQILTKGDSFDGEVIIGVRGGFLFGVDSDFQVSINKKNYMCCGSGSPYAYGSLFTNEKYKMKPHQRLKLALSSAKEFCTEVEEPFKYISI